MRVSIHQPNFLPWLPFFKKIEQADVFVLLNHCQFQRRKHQNRFSYSDNWHTMSTNMGNQSDLIISKIYTNHELDWKKIKSNFKGKEDILNSFDLLISSSLHMTNTQIIIKIMKLLDIKTRIEYDQPTNLVGTERLVDICKKHNATTYISGPSGRDYIDLSLFEKENIHVEFFDVDDKHKIHVLDVISNNNI